MKRLIILLGLSCMLWVFYQQHYSAPKVKPKRPKAQEYMRNLAITDYTVDGELKQSVAANKWEFIPYEQQSKIYSPNIVVYKPNGDIWHISARSALAKHTSLADKIQAVDMYDDVIMQRKNQNKFTPTKVTSQHIHYIPMEEQVSSDVLVTLQQPELVVKGTGMLGYLESNWIRLLDRTTTVYDQHTIKSKQVTFDNNAGTAVYETNVTVDNDDSHLVSDSLSIQRDSHNKIKTMIAFGNPASYTKQGDTIQGPILNYDVATDTLTSKQSTVILQPKQERG